MRAFDRTSGKPLALDLALAQTTRARCKGLLGTKTLPAGTGLWITPCSGIHTIGMKYPIDALFLDRDHRVVGLAQSLPPNRLSRVFFRSRSVLELPAGTLERTGTREGNQVEIVPSDTPPEPQARAQLPGLLFLYLLFLAAHLALVWRLPYFPSQDGPSHLYNLVILNDLLHGGREWGAYYTYSLKAVPNLGFHLVSYPILQFFSPLATEKIFLSLYLALTAAAVPLLLHSFGKRVLPLSFLVFPVLFNYTLLMGFYSYSMAVPLFLAALSLNWRIRRGSLPARFLALNLSGVLLYFFHLTPWIFFLLAVGLRPVACGAPPPRSRARLRELGAALGREMALALPQLAMLLHYLAGSFPGGSEGYRYLFSLPRTAELFAELFLFSTVTFSKLQLLPAVVLLATFCLLARASLREGPGNAEEAAGERYLGMLVALLVLIYFLAPFRLGEGAYFNDRFPWVVYLLALPLFRPARGTDPRQGALLVTAASICLFSNLYFLTHQSSRVQEFVSAAPVLPKGAQVMMYKDEPPLKAPVDPLLHAISYQCIAHTYVDVGNYETRFSYFPVHFSPALPKLPAPETIAYTPALISWAEFPSIEYLFGVGPAHGTRARLAGFFQVLHERGPFSLWQRRAEFSGAAQR